MISTLLTSSLLVSPSLEKIELYKNAFQQDRKVVFTDLMEPTYARTLQTFLTRLLPRFWYCATCIRRDRAEKAVTPGNSRFHAQRIAIAQSAFSRGEFAYYFYRTFNAIPGEYSPLEIQLRAIISSPVMISLLKEVTGLEITRLRTLFVAKYSPGCFLSTHSDHGNGKIAFVIHLTEGWKPQYGGNLHFLNEERDQILEVFSPIFNSMMIFEVPEPNGIPHFVGHVAPGTPVERITITGWFD